MIDLDELERLLAEATPGPWHLPGGARLQGVVSAMIGERDAQVADASGEAPQHDSAGRDVVAVQRANAILIAAMRNALPELLAAARERDALRQRVSDLRFALGDNAGWFDRARKAEAERDDWRRAAKYQNRQWSQKCTEATELRASLEKARDCGQDTVCVLSPGCQRHWEERNRELVAERDAARADLETARRERDEAIALLAGADSPEAVADALTDRLRALRSALDEVL